jgi:hypothetical protein
MSSPAHDLVQSDREPTYEDRMRTPFPRVDVLSLSSASTRLFGVVVARGVCGYTPIFPQGLAVRPEKRDKLTRLSLARITFCVMSLSLEDKRLCYTPLMW